MKYRIKKRIRPQSKHSRRVKRQKVGKIVKNLIRSFRAREKSSNSGIFRRNRDAITKGILKGLKRRRTFDREDPRFRGVHPEEHTLKNHYWDSGLLTLKFQSNAFSANSPGAQSKRKKFLIAYMNNLRVKLDIKNSQFLWVACEEFGKNENGHLHVLFSFDCLTEKNREKIQNIDFSNDGSFAGQARESVDFVAKNMGLDPKSVIFDWSPEWDQDGLVGYFCKIERGHDDKFFHLDPILKKANPMAA